MRPILAWLLIVLPAVAGADVFKYTDSDGNVVYTDQPREGAERIRLPEISTYRNRVQPRLSESAPKGGDQQAAYHRFVIAQPAPDATVWDNNGNLSVKIEVDPALKVGAGHRVQVGLDGEALPGTFDSTEFTLTNIDRGTHSVSASIVDGSGRTLATAPAVTFHMKRQSQLFPGKEAAERTDGEDGDGTDGGAGESQPQSPNVRTQNPNILSNNPNIRTQNPNVLSPPPPSP